MKLYENIRNKRIELGMTQDELAKRMGYKSRSTIAKIEAGINDIPQSKIISFAQALNTTAGELMGTIHAPLAPHTSLSPAKYKKFKVLGNIACGNPIEAIEEQEEYIETELNIHADYVLQCQGDSMINARVFNGDYVFIREQPEVENGEIAAVWMDGNVTLKRFYRHEDYIELRAENPTYKPIIIHEADFDSIHVIGKAVACQFIIKD